MTVTQVHRDVEALTMTVTANFGAAIESVWEMWANPRLLERWWGPPTFPATVVDHDLAAGGRVTSFMTGPEGEQYHGWWRVISVSAPNMLEIEDGFADDAGTPNLEMPTTRMRVTLDERADGGTRMLMVSVFGSLEQMEQLVEMGMEDGITAAVGQIDALLLD